MLDVWIHWDPFIHRLLLKLLRISVLDKKEGLFIELLWTNAQTCGRLRFFFKKSAFIVLLLVLLLLLLLFSFSLLLFVSLWNMFGPCIHLHFIHFCLEAPNRSRILLLAYVFIGNAIEIVISIIIIIISSFWKKQKTATGVFRSCHVSMCHTVSRPGRTELRRKCRFVFWRLDRFEAEISKLSNRFIQSTFSSIFTHVIGNSLYSRSEATKRRLKGRLLKLSLG